MSDDLIDRMDYQIGTWDYYKLREDWQQYQNDYLAARDRIKQLTAEVDALETKLAALDKPRTGSPPHPKRRQIG
jgi:polyhydroxyalkanoate synthesis regulator phasin